VNGQHELSIDAIIAELTALSAERLRELEVMPVKRGSRLSEDLHAVALGTGLGVMHAVRRIEEMRRRAAVPQAHPIRNRPVQRKRDGDV